MARDKLQMIKKKKTEHYMEAETEQTDFTALKLPLATETQASLTF